MEILGLKQGSNEVADTQHKVFKILSFLKQRKIDPIHTISQALEKRVA